MPQSATPASAYTAMYDAWNRLMSVSASGTIVAKYSYDGVNRRIVKLAYTGGTLSEARHFYFTQNWQTIEERTGASTSMDKEYVWGKRSIDELVCRDDATPLRLYATQDANFNLTAIVSTTGSVQERFLYDPYGNSAVFNGSWSGTTDSYNWTIGFQCGIFDSASELYIFRKRHFSKALGR